MTSWIQFSSDEQVSYVFWLSEGYYWWVSDGFIQSVGGVKDWEVFNLLEV